MQVEGVRRGVRSDAQLKPTETRFQKCSQSGKNGSKHPMLSISMAYNVISCKKIERNTQRIKIAKKTDHSIAIYSIFCIGMVYFGCLQVNLHIQAVQNMCGKGSQWVFLGTLGVRLGTLGARLGTIG